MNLRKFIISSFYIPFRFYNFLLYLLKGKQARLRILLMHDVPERDYENFRKKLEYLSLRWNFISTQDLEEHFSGNKCLQGNNLLLSFDDGFYSNRIVAENILNPLGIKALFFVVSNFVSLKHPKEQIKFIKNNLYPTWRDHDYPENIDTMSSMSHDDLRYLTSCGHTIGCHTESHLNLSTISDDSELISEIIESGNKLEAIIDAPVEHFSFGFGNVSFFSEKALEIARQRFKFIHTGMRGDNAKNVSSWALRRDTIALGDSNFQMSSFLEGSADFRYKQDFELYESWGDI